MKYSQKAHREFSIWHNIGFRRIFGSVWCGQRSRILWNTGEETGQEERKVLCIQLFQLRLSPGQSGKVEYERERLLGIANKFINLLAIPSSLARSYSTFPLCSGDNLNWNSCIHSTFLSSCPASSPVFHNILDRWPHQTEPKILLNPILCQIENSLCAFWLYFIYS
jgi:hypothetical protein